MSTTATDGYELRWFYKGEPTPELSTWFDQLHAPETLEPPDTRSDFYLRAPEGNEVGLKLRQARGKGRLELKLRIGSWPLVGLNGGISGQGERWQKWTWDLSEDYKKVKKLRELVVDSWEAEKERYQWKNKITADGDIQPVKDGPWDFAVELTNLKIKDSKWWTLAFDADSPAHLLKGVEWFFGKWKQQGDLPDLPQSGDSYGYPEWLLRS